MKCNNFATMDGDEPQKRRRTNYSAPENARCIANAVQILIQQGKNANVRNVADLTGIPYNTLRDHYKKATSGEHPEPNDIAIVDAYDVASESGGQDGSGTSTTGYGESSKRRGRKPRLPKVAEYFLKTFAIEMEQINAPLDRTQLKQVALYISSELQVPEFKATDMWVQAFQTRNKLNITKTNPKNKSGWRLNPAFLCPNFANPAPPQNTVQEQISTLLSIFHNLLEHLSSAIAVTTEPVWMALLQRAQDVQTPVSVSEQQQLVQTPAPVANYPPDAIDTSNLLPSHTMSSTSSSMCHMEMQTMQPQRCPPLALPDQSIPPMQHENDTQSGSLVTYPFFRTRLPEFPPETTCIEALTARSDVPFLICASSNHSTPTPTSVATTSTVTTQVQSTAGDDNCGDDMDDLHDFATI